MPPLQLLPRRRSGFTLIEILVVIAIVAILVGLLIPAVQTARTAVNRTVSANNLNQIGIGMHAFHDDRGYLPYNGRRDWWGFRAQVESGSWAYQLLPYIDEGPVYFNTTSTNLASGNIIGPLDVRVAVYCDPERARPTMTEIIDIARSGPTTDYALNCWLNAKPGDDITGAPNRKIRLEAIPDGVSSTVLVGFSALSQPDYDRQVSQSWNETWYVGGYGGSGRDGFECLQDSPTTPYNDHGFGQWGSPYPNGCYFLFCDGSVHLFTYGTDLTAIILPDDGAQIPPFDD
jgi:prepilin-type N-terminal cleavage/methylation domain-containing protein